MRPGLYIQTRVDSSRLPGKALLELNGIPSLSWVIRNTRSKRYSTTILTTNRTIDDPIEAIAISERVKCYRFGGEVDNVLARFYHGTQGKHIIRATADCLGLEARSVHETLDALMRSKVDYAYSGFGQGYPQGYGCEAFTRDILEKAYEKSTTLYQREHVTPWIKENGRWAEWKIDRYDGFNMELNTPEDYERIKNIYEHQYV